MITESEGADSEGALIPPSVVKRTSSENICDDESFSDTTTSE